MADKFAQAVIEFVTDASRFMSGTDAIEKRSADLQQSFGKVGKSLLSAFALPVTAAGAVAMIGKLGAEAIEAAGRIVDLSNKTGISTEEIQRMEYAARLTGTSVEALASASYKLGINLQSATDPASDVGVALARIGLSLEDIKKLNPEQQFNVVVEALSHLKSVTEQNMVGQALFGKQFAEIGGAIRDGYVPALKGATVATDDQVRALKAAGEEWEKFKATVTSSALLAFGSIAANIRSVHTAVTAAAADVGSLTQAERRHFESISSWIPGQTAMLQRAFLVGVQQRREAAAAADAETRATIGTTAAVTDYTRALAGVRREVAGLTPAQKAQIDAAVKLGVANKDLAVQVGVSEAALRLYVTQANAAAGATKKAADAGVIWGDGLSALQKLQVEFNIELDETDHGAAAAAEAMGFLNDEIARARGEAISTIPTLDELGVKVRNLGVGGVGASPFQFNLSPGVTPQAPFDPKFMPLPTSAWSTAISGWASQLPSQIARAFEGGGGWRGAFQAGASSLGSSLGGALFGQAGVSGFAKNLSGWFGQVVSAAGPIIGALAGPLIGKLLGALAKPEYKKIAQDIGRQWGIAISDGLAQQIEKDAKELFGKDRVAASLFNLSSIIGEAGGLSEQNLPQMTAKLRDVFSMIETHQFTIAQGAKVIDDNWAAFVAAGTDGNGRLSASLKEIIALNERFGLQSKAIAEYLRGQAQAAMTGFGAVVAAAAQATTNWHTVGEEVKNAQKNLDDLKASGKATETELAAAHERLARALADQAKNAAGAKTELSDLGIQALAAYNAAIKSGMDPAAALASIHPALETLRQAYKDLGLPIDDAALSALLLQDTIASGNPALMSGVSGLTQSFIALSNMGLLNAETFAAMQRSGAQMYTRLQAAAAAAGQTGEAGTRAALAPMQTYLHEAEKAAKELGIPLDDNTAELIRQSKELGIWKDAGKTAAEQQIDSLNTLNQTMEKFGKLIEGIFDKAAGNPFAGWQPPGAPGVPDGGTSGSPEGTTPVYPQAAGGDFLVRHPTLFLAGDTGLERATFTPAGQGGQYGGAPAIIRVEPTVNMHIAGSVIAEQDLAKTVAKAFNSGGEAYEAMVRLIGQVRPGVSGAL